jgi:hypothetical protein
MAAIFQQDPFISPKVVFGRENEQYQDVNNQTYHEAGYDAYVTGLSLLRILGLDSSKRGEIIDLKDKALFGNKIHCMQSLMTFINFGGADGNHRDFILDIPDTKNVFLIRNFPATWKTGDILGALKDLGQITYHWIDDQSCIVVVKDQEKVSIAVEMAKVIVYDVIIFRK